MLGSDGTEAAVTYRGAQPSYTAARIAPFRSKNARSDCIPCPMRVKGSLRHARHDEGGYHLIRSVAIRQRLEFCMIVFHLLRPASGMACMKAL